MQANPTAAVVWLPAGHIQRLIVPAITTVVQRARSFSHSAETRDTLFSWVAVTGSHLLDRLHRTAHGHAIWEQVQLHLNADDLGLLAYSLNALQDQVERGNLTESDQQKLLEQTRQALWHTLPRTTLITCFLPRDAISEFLLPRLRLLSAVPVEPPTLEPELDPRWAADLATRLVTALHVVAANGSKLIRFQAPLNSLAAVHRVLPRWRGESGAVAASIEQIRQGLARVLDPLVLRTTHDSASTRSWASATATAGEHSEPRPPRGQLPPHGRRFLAYLLDAVLSAATTMWVIFFLSIVAFDVSPSVSDATLEQLVVVGGYAAYFGYYVLPTAYLSGTLGKRLLGLRVVDERGASPGLARTIGRYLVWVILSVLLLTWWPVLLRQDRRALHDLATGLWVVYEPSPPSSATA